MSRRQFGYLAGFLLVWLAWASGPIVVAAVGAGVIGYLGVRALEGDLDLGAFTERFRSDRRP
ncbi:MAG: hypothetical protein ACRD0J_01945 [Acidimicrobiales bacterium]